MKRKGYPAEGVNDFCDLISVTRRGNENFISFGLLEHCIRKCLEGTTERTLAVVDPVLVHLTNVDEKFEKTCKGLFFPKNPEKGGYDITLCKEFYIEREDIRDEAHPDFFGVCPGQTCGLKYAGVIMTTQVLKDSSGRITEAFAEFLPETKTKPKSFVNWISRKDSVNCEVRLYDVLFNIYDPNTLKENWLQGLNPKSLVVVREAKMNRRLLGLKPLDRIQFER